MTRPVAIVVALLLAGATVLLKLRPEILSHFGPPCVFHSLTGLYCPGCGGTRAAILLLRGDIPGAIRMNVFAVIVIACVPIALVRTYVVGKPINWVGTSGKPGKAIAFGVLAFFILRNVPIAPFTYLAPIELRQYDKAAANPGRS